MGVKATKGEGGNFKLAPSGSHIARCYAVIDMGTQSWEYKGNVNTGRKVQISWELPNEMHVFDEKKGPQPISVHKEFTLSTDERSNLRKFAESWISRPLTSAEIENLDVSKFLGRAGTVTVQIKKSAAGKERAEVTGVTALVKSTTCPPLINPKVDFAIGEGDFIETFKKFPQWMQDKIASSPEWKEATKGITITKNEVVGEDESFGEASGEGEEMPF